MRVELRLPQVKFWLTGGQIQNGLRAPGEFLSHHVIGREGTRLMKCRRLNDPVQAVRRGRRQKTRKRSLKLLSIANFM